MSVRAPGWLAILMAAFVACTEHEPELDRVGGPMPDAGGGCPDQAGEIPCKIQGILKNHCQRCHASPQTVNGAPFPLMTYCDLFRDYGERLVYQAMHNAIDTSFMPLCADGSCPPAYVATLVGGPGTPLSAEDKQAMLDYLKQEPKAEYGQNCP